MKFLANRKLAIRISIITTAINFTGMILLWLIVSSRISSMVQNNATNQMIDAVESRAAIINSRRFLHSRCLLIRLSCNPPEPAA